MMIKKTIVLAMAVLLISIPAWAEEGNLEVDNLDVNDSATFYGTAALDAPNGDIPMGVFTNRQLFITGGTITTSGSYRIHTFTQSGTFKVSGGSIVCEVLAVAGGGGGGGDNSGGGGAGGVVHHTNYVVSSTSISVTVGAGGAGNSGTGSGQPGSNSVFGPLTANGGGYGGHYANGGGGGSGGGGNQEGLQGGAASQTNCGGGIGYGNNGAGSGNAGWYGGSGGGGAGGVGSTNNDSSGGNGGVGKEFSQFADVGGSPAGWFAGGGGGSANSGGTPAGGGDGGGGDGSGWAGTAENGVANTGGGGGGGGGNGGNGGAGGSGIVEDAEYGDDTTTEEQYDPVAKDYQIQGSLGTYTAHRYFSQPCDGTNCHLHRGTNKWHDYHEPPSPGNPNDTNIQLIVKSGSVDMPAKNWKRIYLVSCYSGKYFYYTFNSGVLFYTVKSVYQESVCPRDFIRAVIEGEDNNGILDAINASETEKENQPINDYHEF